DFHVTGVQTCALPISAGGQGMQFSIQVELDYNGERRVVTGSGDGAISAFVAALGIPVRIMDYHEHAIGTGTDTRAASYVELRVRSEERRVRKGERDVE